MFQCRVGSAITRIMQGKAWRTYVLGEALAASDNGQTVGAVRVRVFGEKRLHPLLSLGRLISKMIQRAKHTTGSHPSGRCPNLYLEAIHHPSGSINTSVNRDTTADVDYPPTTLCWFARWLLICLVASFPFIFRSSPR